MSAADPAPALPPVRLFIGGLPPGAESALTERLAPFGEVTDVTIPAPKGGADRRGFVYATLAPADDRAVARCLSTVRERKEGERERGAGGGTGRGRRF